MPMMLTPAIFFADISRFRRDADAAPLSCCFSLISLATPIAAMLLFIDDTPLRHDIAAISPCRQMSFAILFISS